MVRFLLLAAPALTGIVFLFAGFAKAVEPQGFLRHLRRLRLISPNHLTPAVVGIPAIQCFQGAALILGIGYSWLLPLSLVLVIALAGLTFWSTTTGRVEDCGCYNNFLAISPQQSLLLDAVYAVLLALGMLGGAEPRSAHWKWWAAMVMAVAGGAVAWCALQHFRKTGGSLFALHPLRIGRRWKGTWIGSEVPSEVIIGERIIAFLGPNCGMCRKWIPVLNMIHQRPGLPGILGVFPGAQESQGYLAEIRFPIVRASHWSITRLTRGVTPTAVVLVNGIIHEVWIGTIPSSFLERIRQEMLKPLAKPSPTGR